MPALDRGLALIELLCAQPAGVSFSTMSSLLGTASASTNRLLRVLLARGWASKGVDGLYRAGPALSPLGRIQHQVTAAASEAMARLTRECGQTTVLVGWDGHLCRCLHKVQDSSSLAMMEIGHVAAAACWYNPWGWLFAWGEPRRRRHWLLAGPDPQRISALLADELERYRRTGVVADLAVMAADRHRLASPIAGPDGRIVAALGLGGTVQGLDDETLQRIIPRLTALAGEISRAIGGSGTMPNLPSPEECDD